MISIVSLCKSNVSLITNSQFIMWEMLFLSYSTNMLLFPLLYWPIFIWNVQSAHGCDTKQYLQEWDGVHLSMVQSFTMLPSSFISGSCQPLQFPLYLEATYTFVSIGLTYTTMKPSPHLGLLITRHSRDFISNIMVILKFSPLQLIR